MKNRYIIPGILFLVMIFRCPPVRLLSPTVGINDIIQVMYIVGVVSILGLFVARENIWAGCLIWACCFSYMYPVCSRFSIESLFIVVLGGILYLVLIKEHNEIIFNLMIVFCTIHCLILVCQFFEYMPPIYGKLKPASLPYIGMMGNRNGAAITIALCLPAFFRFKWLIPIPAIGLLITQSYGGALASLVAVLIYLVTTDGKYAMFYIAFAFLAGILYLLIDTPSPGDRWNLWAAAIRNHFYQTWAKVPNQSLFGFGIGNWNIIRPYSGFEMFGRLHNTFVQGFVEMGFPFLIILIGYARNIIKRVNHAAILQLSALGAIITCCMVNSVFQLNAVNGMLIIIWLASLELKLRKI